jgi:hypothetical protein
MKITKHTRIKYHKVLNQPDVIVVREVPDVDKIKRRVRKAIGRLGVFNDRVDSMLGRLFDKLV